MGLRHPPPTNIELDLVLKDLVALPFLSLSHVREAMLRDADSTLPPGSGRLVSRTRAPLEEGEFP